MCGIVCLLVVVASAAIWWRNDPAASFRRGLVALEKGDVPAMHREVQILRRYPRYEPEVHLLRGAIFLSGLNPQSALQEFDRCAVHPATRVHSLTLAGEAFARMDRDKSAINVLQQALTFAPNHLPAHRWLAIVYTDNGSHDLAIAELRKVSELAPQDYRPHRILGTIHKADGRYAEAVQDYRATLRLAPQQPSRKAVLLDLSQSLARLRRYAEALTFLDKADQSSPDVWGCRAGCEYRLGHKTAARQAASKALELNPKHLEGLLWMGILEADAGRLVPATDYLERAIKSHPLDATARKHLASVYQRQGQPAAAQKQLEQIETYQKLREKFTKLEEQTHKRPQDASLRYELGETARELQLFKLARKWYAAALTLNPGYEKARQALEKLPTANNSTGLAATLSPP